MHRRTMCRCYVSTDICISYSSGQAAGHMQVQALPGVVFATSLTAYAAAPMADSASAYVARLLPCPGAPPMLGLETLVAAPASIV